MTPEFPPESSPRTRRHLWAIAPVLLLAMSATAQDASKVQPQNYRVVLDNAEVRVLEFVSPRGRAVCGNGMHSHPAHLTVAVTPGKVRVKTADGKEFVAENKAGDVFWSPAETHATENVSGQEIRALIVEIKARKG